MVRRTRIRASVTPFSHGLVRFSRLLQNRADPLDGPAHFDRLVPTAPRWMRGPRYSGNVDLQKPTIPPSHHPARHHKRIPLQERESGTQVSLTANSIRSSSSNGSLSPFPRIFWSLLSSQRSDLHSAIRLTLHWYLADVHDCKPTEPLRVRADQLADWFRCRLPHAADDEVENTRHGLSTRPH